MAKTLFPVAVLIVLFIAVNTFYIYFHRHVDSNQPQIQGQQNSASVTEQVAEISTKLRENFQILEKELHETRAGLKLLQTALAETKKNISLLAKRKSVQVHSPSVHSPPARLNSSPPRPTSSAPSTHPEFSPGLKTEAFTWQRTRKPSVIKSTTLRSV